MLGIDAKSFSITANASEYSTDVQAVPNLDGITAQGQMSSFNFGGEGKLQFANGFLVAPDKADSYPRIGTLKAFELLKTGSGTAVGRFLFGGPTVATTAPMPTESPTSVRDGLGTNCMGYDPATGVATANEPGVHVRVRDRCRRSPGDDRAVPVDTLLSAAAHDRSRRSADVAVGASPAARDRSAATCP